MSSLQAILRFQDGIIRKLSSFAIWMILAISAISVPRADAAFVGYYQLSNFSLMNVDADGFAMTPNSGQSVVLTGGNDGSGQPGTTDLTIAANAAGLVAFSFFYSSFDFPTFDYAGYILGPTFLQFADTDGQSATVSFPVSAGQIFGFRVGTFDNTGEPGVLTVTNFEAPSASTVVPEPGTLALVLNAAAIIGVLRAARAFWARKSHYE